MSEFVSCVAREYYDEDDVEVSVSEKKKMREKIMMMM
jgi:hypothetical protein